MRIPIRSHIRQTGSPATALRSQHVSMLKNLMRSGYSERQALDLLKQGPKVLPVKRIGGKLWFIDVRLNEARNVNNPNERMSLDQFNTLNYMNHLKRKN